MIIIYYAMGSNVYRKCGKYASDIKHIKHLKQLTQKVTCKNIIYTVRILLK